MNIKEANEQNLYTSRGVQLLLLQYRMLLRAIFWVRTKYSRYETGVGGGGGERVIRPPRTLIILDGDV